MMSTAFNFDSILMVCSSYDRHMDIRIWLFIISTNHVY